MFLIGDFFTKIIKRFLPNFLIILSQGFIAFIVVLIDFIFSKKLTLVEFGSWKQVFIFLNILIPVVAFGVAEGFKYYIAKEKDAMKYLNNLVFFLVSVALILFLLIGLMHLLHLFHLINLGVYYQVSFLFPLAFLAFITSLSIRYYYINDNDIVNHTRIILFFIPVTFVLLILFYFFSDFLKVYYVFYGLAIYSLLFGIPIYFLLKKIKYKFKFSDVNKAKILEMLSQGFPLYIATFVGLLSLNLDKIIVSTYENKQVFALFAAGAIEIPIFAMISAAFSNNDYPKLVQEINEGNVGNARNIWLQTTKNVSYFIYPLILLFMLFSKQIIFVLYNENYMQSIFFFKTYLLIGLFRNNFYGALMAASGKSKIVGYYSIALLIMNLFFSFSMYRFFGVKGVVFGPLISTFIYTLFQLNHEGLLRSYFLNFVMDKIIFLLIMAIFIAYFFI